jgi:hypothetical protein
MELDRAKLEKGFSVKKIQTIAKANSLHLPDQLVVFYNQVSQVEIYWSLQDDRGIIYRDPDYPNTVAGRIRILSLETMLEGFNKSMGWKEIIWFDFMDDMQKQELQMIRPFDYYYPDYASCSAFVITHNHIKDNLALYSNKIGLFSMNISLDKYLELLFQTKGYLFWQDAWVFRKGMDCINLKHYLPQLFTNVNLLLFEE